MRVQVHLRATMDASYRTDYHNKLRGRIWRAFQSEEYDRAHEGQEGIGLAFSNVFPWGAIEEGDRRSLLIASPREGVLRDFVTHFRENPQFDIGSMCFRIEDFSLHRPDVGEPGTRGVLETSTGVVCRLSREIAAEYGLDLSPIPEGSGNRLMWRPEHGLEPLQAVIRRSLQLSHDRYGDDYYDGPMEVTDATGAAGRSADETDQPAPLFEFFDPIKDEVVYAINFEPTAGVTLTYLLSKWRLGYRVRDETHRYHLNLALDSGIGQSREHGFGFINVRENERIPAAQAAQARRAADGGHK